MLQTTLPLTMSLVARVATADKLPPFNHRGCSIRGLRLGQIRRRASRGGRVCLRRYPSNANGRVHRQRSRRVRLAELSHSDGPGEEQHYTLGGQGNPQGTHTLCSHTLVARYYCASTPSSFVANIVTCCASLLSNLSQSFTGQAESVCVFMLLYAPFTCGKLLT